MSILVQNQFLCRVGSPLVRVSDDCERERPQNGDLSLLSLVSLCFRRVPESVGEIEREVRARRYFSVFQRPCLEQTARPRQFCERRWGDNGQSVCASTARVMDRLASFSLSSPPCTHSMRGQYTHVEGQILVVFKHEWLGRFRGTRVAADLCLPQ